MDKNANAYNGTLAKFTGQIVQIEEGQTGGYLRMSVTKESYGWSLSDIILVKYINNTTFVKDDVVDVYGSMTGAYTYKSTMNLDITIPSMQGCIIEEHRENINQTKVLPTTIVSVANNTPLIVTKKTETPTKTVQVQPVVVPVSIPAISASCSASQTSINVGQSVNWIAQVSGGNGSYFYSWSGSDGLVGNSISVNKTYSTSGVKNASLNISSGDKTLKQLCTNTVSVIRPTPDPIYLSGFGQQATQQFDLESGLSVFTLTHSGSSNFIVKLLDSNGNPVDYSLVNDIGVFNGSKAIKINQSGKYLLNISADGAWTINIQQPRSAQASQVNSFNDIGQKATQLFYLSQGLHTISMTHSGSSNFIVKLLDNDGNPVDYSLVNEIGSFNGSKAVKINYSGIYLFNVQADGSWSINIQ